MVPTTKASYLSDLEVNKCLAIALEDTAGGADQEIIRTAAKLFGFKRVGPDLKIRLENALANFVR